MLVAAEQRPAFYTMRRPLVQTATGQDDDAGFDRTSERTTILRTHGTGEDDKTLDAAASCKEPNRRLADSFGIERSRCRGIEVVAAVGVPAASSSVVGALGRNRPVQSDQ